MLWFNFILMKKYTDSSKYYSVIVFFFFLTINAQSGFLFKKANSFQTLTEIWELEPATQNGTFLISKYKPIYIMPFRYSSRPNEVPYNSGTEVVLDKYASLDNVELKFQYSFKVKIAQDILFGNGDLWLGYTQKSFWQVFNKEFSRPFRETNYEPELILNIPAKFKVLGIHGKMFGIALNHQSNGRTQTLTRSWNRVIGFVAFEEKNWSLALRTWYAYGLDENPDIKDFTGRGDATLVYLYKRNIFTLHGQHSLKTGDLSNGHIQVDWAFPIRGNLKGHFQFFDGYGDSLIDHNYRQTILGMGISFAEFL